MSRQKSQRTRHRTSRTMPRQGATDVTAPTVVAGTLCRASPPRYDPEIPISKPVTAWMHGTVKALKSRLDKWLLVEPAGTLRAIDRDISSQVASPQSLSPFSWHHQHIAWNRSLRNNHWTQQPMLEKIPSPGYTLAGTVTTRRCGNGLMNPLKPTHILLRRLQRRDKRFVAGLDW